MAVEHTVYRITRRKRAGDLSGEGSRLVGGRYNSVGTRALYTSASVALSLLEVLVHIQLTGSIPDDYQITILDINESIPRPTSTPKGIITDTVDYGDSRLNDPTILGFWVPSVIVPLEYNLVLNPSCTRFNEAVEIRDIVEQRIDERLAGVSR